MLLFVSDCFFLCFSSFVLLLRLLLLLLMFSLLLSFLLEVPSAGPFGKARQGHSEKHGHTSSQGALMTDFEPMLR